MPVLFLLEEILSSFSKKTWSLFRRIITRCRIYFELDKILKISLNLIIIGVIPFQVVISPLPVDKIYKEVSIDEALELALKGSPLLVQPLIEVNKAKLGLSSVKSKNYPQLSLSLRHFIDIFNLDEQRTVPSVDFNYDFFSFIKNKYEAQYYSKLVDISVTNQKLRQSLLLSSVYQEFINYNFLSDTLDLLLQEREMLHATQEILEVKRKYDLISLSTLLENSVLVKKCDQAVFKTRDELQSLIDRFNYITGSDKPVRPEKVSLDFSRLSSRQISDFAEVMAKQNVDATKLLLKGAKMPTLPSLQLDTYSTFPVLKEMSFMKSFWISVTLSYIIYDRGERKRRIASALTSLKEAEYEYEKIKNEKLAEVKMLEGDVEDMRRQIDINKTEIMALEAKLEEAKLEETIQLFPERTYSLKINLFDRKLAYLRNNLALLLIQLDLMNKKYSFIAESSSELK
ncbi:MAG: TolC family protein [Candidatus Aminicenantaceae bacterium]